MRGRRQKRFLDALNTGPSHHESKATSLVICTAGASATERLLTNHGTGAFVVDVEVTGTVTKSSRNSGYGRAVTSKHAACSRVCQRLGEKIEKNSHL